MKTHLDIVHFDTYVAAVAGRAGIRVQWDEPTSAPRTDGKTVFLPRITSKTSDVLLSRLRYFIKHETSHVEYTNFEYTNARKPVGLLMFILNVIEDNRIDNLNDAEFAGDRGISDDYIRIFTNDVIENAASKDAELSDQQKLVAPLLAWSGNHMAYTPSSTVMAKALLTNVGPENMARYEKLMAGNYGERMVALRKSEKGGTDDLFDLARTILKEVFEEDPSKYESSPGTKKEEEGEGEGEWSVIEDGADGKGGESPAKGDIITVEKLMEEVGNHLQSEVGIHWKHKISSTGGWIIPNKDEYVVADFPITHPKLSSRYHGRMDTELVSTTIDEVAKPLSNKLRIRLQVRSQGRYEGNKKSGNIHSGGLHKIITAKGTDSESKVFRRHITSDTLDTSVSLLVDCSGSMSGNKYAVACAAAGSLSYALEPLHIAHCIYGFTNADSHNEEPVIFRFKKWQERVAQAELLKRFEAASAHLSNNSDGDAIAYTAHDLLQQKHHRKILIVLSDGSPSGRHIAGDITRYTHDVIKSIEASKKMEIHGIGIRDRNVTMYYKNNVVINRVGDLPQAVLSIIDKSL